jgi:PmbA protein
MVDRDELLELGRRAVAQSPAEETEAVLMAEGTNLTRFANNVIHQNVTQDDLSLRVRAVFGQRIGVASTNDVSEEGVRRCAETAAEIARHQEENRDFVGLPGPAEYVEVEPDCGETAAFSPEDRAAAVRDIIKVAEAHGLTVSGAFQTGPEAVAVVNSKGVRAAQSEAMADLNVTMVGATSSGRAAQTAMNVAAIDALETATIAAQKAVESADPADVEPGEYTVVLEEDAVADMIRFLGYMGFGGKALLEQRSFMCGKIGERVCGESITIYDDGLDPDLRPLPFDFEGVPRQKVMLIEKGVAKGVVHDRTTAAKAGVDPTGHALPPPATWGPYPSHLHLAPGDSSEEEMIASTERGLLVTRFHYTNIAHTMRTEITGMTRDGTFLIEGGKIARGVKNLRFTQSVLAALSEVELIGSACRIAEHAMVPALKIRKFRFSGATEF